MPPDSSGSGALADILDGCHQIGPDVLCPPWTHLIAVGSATFGFFGAQVFFRSILNMAEAKKGERSRKWTYIKNIVTGAVGVAIIGGGVMIINRLLLPEYCYTWLACGGAIGGLVAFGQSGVHYLRHKNDPKPANVQNSPSRRDATNSDLSSDEERGNIKHKPGGHKKQKSYHRMQTLGSPPTPHRSKKKRKPPKVRTDVEYESDEEGRTTRKFGKLRTSKGVPLHER